jgi:hypothetical protein
MRGPHVLVRENAAELTAASRDCTIEHTAFAESRSEGKR